jgi:hypothetical protein
VPQDYNQKTGFFQFLFSATVICRDLWLAQIAQDIDVMPLTRKKWVSQKNRPGQGDRACCIASIAKLSQQI